MNDILNDIKTYQTAYEQGYTAGRIHFLERLQTKVHQMVEASRVNALEPYENRVVMLKDFDELITKLMWETK